MRFLILLLLSSSVYGSECSQATAKLEFVATCTVYRSGGAYSSAANQECRCAALNFAVEKLVYPSCKYNPEDVLTTMALDVVKLKCGQS